LQGAAAAAEAPAAAQAKKAALAAADSDSDLDLELDSDSDDDDEEARLKELVKRQTKKAPSRCAPPPHGLLHWLPAACCLPPAATT
jgi:hypothetical protein